MAGKFSLSLALLLALWAVPSFAQQSEADIFVAQAILAYDDKRYPEALASLNEALKQDPNNVDALYYTGLVHLAQKKPELAVPALEKARTLAPKELFIRLQLGVAYLTLEQYDKAKPLLSEVFAEQPKTDGVGYYVGFMRYRDKDYQGALQAFQAGTSSDPTLQQLTRFYAGLTLGVLGLPERAIAEVEAALKIQPGSALTGPAERIRETIVAARSREQRLRAEIRVGVFYDDNVAVVPDPSRDALAESLRSRMNRSPGQIFSTRVDYSFLREGPWEATATYSFFQTLNNNHNLSEFNLQDHLGGLSGFYRGAVGALPYQIGLQYNYDYLTLNEAAFLHRNTLTLFGTLVEDPMNLSTAVGRFQSKQFLNDFAAGQFDPAANPTGPDEVRDANNYMIGLTHILRFENDKHLLRLGYQYDYEDAQGRNFSYGGHRIQTGAQYTLPWGSTRLKYDYEVHLRFYFNNNTTFPTLTSTVGAPNTVKRRDTEHLHFLRVEKPLPYNLTLSVEYQATISKSNLDIFNFNRNVASMILTWTY
jgi:tetratricopeptide (TPR) repeat protein